MKNSILFIFLAVGLLCLSSTALAGIAVRTDINLKAEVASSVSVYVEGKNVTNGSITLDLKDKYGYLTGTTPPFFFIGNASSVSLSMTAPAGNQLVSELNDTMGINSEWIRLDGGSTLTGYGYYNVPVYGTLGDIPDPTNGVKVRFTSTAPATSYPLGTYSGTYTLMVTPVA